MLFHMELTTDGAINGWVLPNNPSAIPRITIFKPDDAPVELEANVIRPDLRDRGLHETGMAGFFIDEKIYPNLSQAIDQIEIRDSETNILIYRRFQESNHIDQRLFRFELQAMPDTRIESQFAKHFTLYYGTAQRFPQDTLFGIINNQAANSIYLSGRPNFSQYEQWLRERNFKIIALIRNPYEEMAERLLFARYASGENLPPFVADYIYGLEPLKDMVKHIRFDDSESIRAAFAAMTDPQKQVLTSPLVRSLACLPDELPKSGHVEIALSKLSRMDVVGLRSRFGEFKSILQEVLGMDVFGEYELADLSWVLRVSEQLSLIKQARALITLDLDLYSFIEEAITEAIGPVGSAT